MDVTSLAELAQRYPGHSGEVIATATGWERRPPPPAAIDDVVISFLRLSLPGWGAAKSKVFVERCSAADVDVLAAAVAAEQPRGRAVNELHRCILARAQEIGG
jgi:hypothetical protein